jgi:transcriptional regulator with XRE-family HTH domain
MKDDEAAINRRIANRIHGARASQRLSLDALAAKSGVSRSMISLVERGETSATAVLLEKLAAALNVTLASLFDEGAAASVHAEPIARRNEQPRWKDPESRYVRRSVSPSWVSQPVQIAEVEFPPGGRIAFEAGSRDTPVYQQVWLLKGKMEITIGNTTHRLEEGDCLAMQLGQPTMFHNPGRQKARYVVVVANDASRRKP